jgi:hypothetical protein
MSAIEAMNGQYAQNDAQTLSKKRTARAGTENHRRNFCRTEMQKAPEWQQADAPLGVRTFARFGLAAGDHAEKAKQRGVAISRNSPWRSTLRVGVWAAADSGNPVPENSGGRSSNR